MTHCVLLMLALARQPMANPLPSPRNSEQRVKGLPDCIRAECSNNCFSKAEFVKSACSFIRSMTSLSAAISFLSCHMTANSSISDIWVLSEVPPGELSSGRKSHFQKRCKDVSRNGSTLGIENVQSEHSAHVAINRMLQICYGVFSLGRSFAYCNTFKVHREMCTSRHFARKVSFS